MPLRRSDLRRKTFAWTLAVALSIPATAQWADAAEPKGWRALGLRVVTKTVVAPVAQGVAATASCPRGTKVVSGGAYFHRSDMPPLAQDARDTWVGATTPLDTHKAWYATGYHRVEDPTMRFTVRALCAQGMSVGIYGASETVSPGSTAGGTVSCPSGLKPVGGGAYFHGPDGVAHPGLAQYAWVTASSVFGDVASWYAHGWNLHLGPTVEMRRVVVCTRTPLKTHVIQDEASAETAPGETSAAMAICPDGYRVLTGGSWQRVSIGSPSPSEADEAQTKGSAPFNRRAWFAHGYTGAAPTGQLLVRAICLPA